MKNNQKGLIQIILPVLIIIIIFIVLVFIKNNPRDFRQNLSTNPVYNTENQNSGWVQDDNGWKAVGSPPPCPEPLEFESVVDIQQATSVLYPGQQRSVGYENTGGFRFDKLPNNNVVVKAPMDGEIIQAARFLVSGETQYVFDILSPCGIMNRFDHLLSIPPKLQEIANKLPAAKENDSRSTPVFPPVKISRGETVATAIGLKNSGNTFLSWTVFDFRKKNKISQNSEWAALHPTLDHYAICPFSYLPKEDQDIIKSLPAADYMSGSQSDFCD